MERLAATQVPLSSVLEAHKNPWGISVDTSPASTFFLACPGEVDPLQRPADRIISAVYVCAGTKEGILVVVAHKRPDLRFVFGHGR